LLAVLIVQITAMTYI